MGFYLREIVWLLLMWLGMLLHTHTHTHTTHTLAEGGRGRFTHPCRVIVSKDAEPPDLTSHNSSVTGSLSTPITEQKQQHSHTQTSATHGLVHPHTHIHTDVYVLYFERNLFACSAKSNTQSDTKQAACTKHSCAGRHLKWCNKPHSDTHSCALTQTRCKRSQTLTPTLILCKLPQNSAQRSFSSSPFLSHLLAHLFYFSLFLHFFFIFLTQSLNSLSVMILETQFYIAHSSTK